MEFTTRRNKPGSYVVTRVDNDDNCIIFFDEGKHAWFCQKDDKISDSFRMKREAKDFAIQIMSGGKVNSSSADVINESSESLKEKTDREIIEEQRIRFEAIDAMARMTLTGMNRGLIVSGPAGIGKTFGIQTLADELYDEGQIRYHFIKGYTRPIGLYTKLFEYSNPGDVLIVDDCDSVFRDEIGLNLLKAALDTSGRRIISWNSKSIEGVSIENDDGEKISVPKSFEYRGAIIFLTNIDFDSLILKNNKMSPHFEALVSRCHYIDCGMPSKREKLLRVMDVCHSGKMLRNQCGLSEDMSEIVIKFMEVNVDKLREISLRMALKIGLLAAGNVERWKEMATVTCLR